ncbi:MAG: DUF6485 family protein [bacterium]
MPAGLDGTCILFNVLEADRPLSRASKRRVRSGRRRARPGGIVKPQAQDCPNRQSHVERCACSYEPCSRKGMCCACVEYHRSKRELPACYFPESVERTYDRSIRRFLQAYGG